MKETDTSIRILTEFMQDMIYRPEKAAPAAKDICPEFLPLLNGLKEMQSSLDDARKYAAALAEGRLEYPPPPPPQSELTAPLKSLQASLKHLTWQARQIAKGDYSQTVDFMGEFSLAFNAMTKQLGTRQRELENKAIKDHMTGLYNRRFGMDVLNNLYKAGGQFCLSFIDLDNLKYVNDFYGHSEGDAYIIQVAEAMQKVCETGVNVRIGGDEFMSLLPGHSAAATLKLLEEIASGFKDEAITPDAPVRRISYGIVSSDEKVFTSAGEILALADGRMYKMKRRNKKMSD